MNLERRCVITVWLDCPPEALLPSGEGADVRFHIARDGDCVKLEVIGSEGAVRAISQVIELTRQRPRWRRTAGASCL